MKYRKARRFLRSAHPPFVKEKGAAEMSFWGQKKLPTDERTKIAVRCEAKAFGCCAKAAVAVAVSAPQVSDDLGEL